MKKTNVTLWIIMLLSVISCKKDDDSISYPYTEYEFIYLGSKPGLTSNSTNEQFSNSLDEVIVEWATNNSSEEDIIFDKIIYELDGGQDVTSAVPNYLWDMFWDNLDEYSYSIGSCWILAEAKIPSKGKVGSFYMLIAIVTNKDITYGGEVLYSAFKFNLIPNSSLKSLNVRNKKSTFINEFKEIIKDVEFSTKKKILL